VKVYDFCRKLLQPSLINRLKEYAKWQRKIQDGDLTILGNLPDFAPISINLDLTTACNFRCTHCIDLDILNQQIMFEHENLLNSLDRMSKKGLKSVILIGGGEPTLYPKLGEIIIFLKEKGIKIGIVTNGSNMEKISEIAHLFDNNDWIRLSLDSGKEETFQKMHNPRIETSLKKICKDVYEIKKKHKNLTIGFSYVVTWSNIHDGKVISNIDEIVDAARLAKNNGFNYISIKPFLERSPENSAELIGIIHSSEEYQETIRKIRESIQEAKKLETDSFEVRESNNLKALENGNFRNIKQPKNCHMIFFRGVLSPLGAFICPGFRNIEKAKIGDKNAYADEENYKKTKLKTAEKIKDFNAYNECKNVTCLYNDINWFIEDLIQHPEKIEQLQVAEEIGEYFL